ncbi:hypothetical protein H7F33_09000 [Pedobacter sp. PAMC26386]|nr:hypothetical protein H7F33_09000 [Pedobacter sp. PAMC26386]
MKTSLLLILLTALFSCKNHTETTKPKGDLNYIATALPSELISAELNLTAHLKTQELQTDLKLSNKGNSVVVIRDIEISTPEGLRSLPETGNIDSIILEPGNLLGSGKSKELTLKFHPLNDLKVHQLTGKNGYLKSSYTILMTYSSKQHPEILYQSINAKLTPEDYQNYLKKHKIPATSYSFNTKSDFMQKQKTYFTTLKQIKQPPFVFVSDQEIAVSGVNLRLNSYCVNDTLNAEIFIVNHSDFPIQVHQNKLDFNLTEETNLSRKPGKSEKITPLQKPILDKTVVTLEKISGSPQKKDRIEKGDRVLIHLKKHFKNTGDKAILSFSKAFELSDKIPLFKHDIELIKVDLPSN